MALVTLQAIFQDAFPTYEQRHALPAHVRRAAHALMQCRTAALGGCLRINVCDPYAPWEGLGFVCTDVCSSGNRIGLDSNERFTGGLTP